MIDGSLPLAIYLNLTGNWQLGGPHAYGCSMQTWERFLRGVAVRDRSFLAFCKVLNLSATRVAEFASSGRTELFSELEAPLTEESESNGVVLPPLTGLTLRGSYPHHTAV